MSDATGTHSTKIFITLIVALIVSMAITYGTHAKWALVGIFVIAAIKAYLVLTHFVGLGREPKYIKIIVGTAIATLLIFYFTLVPDIVWVETELP